MPAAKMETAAERYRRIKAEKERGETLHDVTCDECKMDWKTRRVGVDFWVSSGILPLHLVETMIEATGKTQDPDKVLKTMAAKEVIESIAFSSKVVRYTAVEPKIVETPKEPNDIAYEEVMTCCYKRLLHWQMQGGDEAKNLSNFPHE